MKLIARNKKAFFDYEILETLEAGLVLTGDEVKSLRAGNANLVGSFATVKDNQLYLLNMHIPPYSHAYSSSEERTRRTRKLLVHRLELNRMIGDISRKGITVVPLKLYFNNRGLVKVELGLAKHKKAPSKKRELKERDIARETERQIRGKY